MAKKFTLKDFFRPRAAVRQMSDALKIKITEFLADNSKLLVIIADPDTDAVVVGYGKYLEAHRIVAKSTGEGISAVSRMLQYKQDDPEIRDSINQFLLLLDGSVHDIAKKIAEETKVENQKP